MASSSSNMTAQSKVHKDWIREFGVEELDWPAQSPDLNVILNPMDYECYIERSARCSGGARPELRLSFVDHPHLPSRKEKPRRVERRGQKPLEGETPVQEKTKRTIKQRSLTISESGFSTK